MKKISIGLFFSFCSSMLLAQAPVEQTTIENLGKNVNSPFAELRPVISGDGKTLYFVVEGNPQNVNYPVDNRAQDVWFSTLDITGTGWNKAEQFSAPVNSRTDNAIFWTSPDGSEILIRGAYENGQYYGRGFSFCQKTMDGWSDPKMLYIDGYQTMSQDIYDGATLSSDKKTLLLYMSEVKNSFLNDIYISRLQEDSIWSTPEKLMDSISLDDYDEVAPFIAYDDYTLYFASSRPGGYGGYDIYKTTRLDDSWTRWSKPVNLGKPINTLKSEAYFTLDIQGDYAYMATMTANNKTDIVKVQLSEDQKPKKSSIGTRNGGNEQDSLSYKILNSLDLPAEVKLQIIDLSRRSKEGGVEGEKAVEELKIITTQPAEFFKQRKSEAIERSQGISPEESGINQIVNNYNNIIQQLEKLDSIDLALLSSADLNFTQGSSTVEKPVDQKESKEKDKYQEGSESEFNSNINWIGNTAPGGSTNHTYQWSQTGNLVTLRISLLYDIPGKECKSAVIELPADCPTPFEPKGFKANGSILYFGTGYFMESNTSDPVAPNAYTNVLRKNASGTGYEIFITRGTAIDPSVCYTTIQYYTY
jgi:hypothetical protein